MKTIEERAKEFAPDLRDPDYILYSEAGYVVNRFREAYIAGAAEQLTIDVEKACKWMKEQVYQEYGGGPLERLIPDTRIEEFRKAMEKEL